MSKEVTDLEKTILTGRIYPAIQSCVGNRYKIIIGYFAIVGFLLVNDEVLKRFIEYKAAALLAAVFMVFAIFNLVNYWLNAKEQWKLEGIKKKFPLVEFLSTVVMVGLIWGGYFVLKQFACSA